MSPVESNAVPFEVIEDFEENPRTGIEVAVYAYDDPNGIPIDVIPRRLSPSCLIEVNRPGAGSFNLLMSDKKILETTSLLDERNIVKMSLDQRVVGGFIIQKKNEIWVEDGEYAGAQYQVSGEGFRTWLNDAIVEPYGGPKLNSPTERVFSFASEQGSWYKPEDWVTPTNIAAWSIEPDNGSPWNTAPAEWPDAPGAYWIWASGTAAPGYCYFRYEFDIAPEVGTANYSFFSSGDNHLEVYVDSGLVTENRDLYAWSKTYRADFELDPGHHVIAAKVRNLDGVGGFIGALFKAGDATADPPVAATLMKVTGESGWLINEYPDPAPGWTPGEIMLTLLAEASEDDIRMADTLVPTFTATHDSDGAEWSRALDWSFQVGSTYTSVVEKLEEVVCDVWVNPANYELNMSAVQGVHRDEQDDANEPVQFQIGRNVKRAGENSEADLKNYLLMQTKEGLVSYTDVDTDSIAKYGILKGYVSGDSSIELAGDVARSVFARHAEPLRSATFDVIDTNRARPFVDFFPGDWVLAPGRNGEESRRVMSIAFAERDRSHIPQLSIEFDTISEDREARLERWLKTTQPGTLGGTVANAGGGGATATQSGGVGPAGGAGGEGPAGSPGVAWQGDWSNTVDYVVNDVVFYNGSSWIAVNDHSGSTPSDVSGDWDRFTGSATLTAEQLAAMLEGPGAARDKLEDLYGGFRSAAPTSGTWAVADKVWNTLPSGGEYVGWICITAGTPGVWKGFGLIEA